MSSDTKQFINTSEVKPSELNPSEVKHSEDVSKPVTAKTIIRRNRRQEYEELNSKKILHLEPDAENNAMHQNEEIDPNKAQITDVAIAVAGSIDSGKSSWVGVMFSGELDNGNGLARNHVAKHKHEIDSGKTSDISTRVVKMGNGKAVTLVDLCGHERYLGTTTFGITGHYPDYAVVIVAANRGILKMTKEHLGILFHMQIPIVILITRVDLLQEDNVKIYDETVKGIERICSFYKKQPTFINSRKEFYMSAADLAKEESIACSKMEGISNELFKTCEKIPVITISNKTGYYISVVKQLITHFKPRSLWDASAMNGSVFYIDSVFKVDGIGIVFSGIVKGNTISVGDTLYLGPRGKDFIPIKIKSIHNNNREHLQCLKDHQRGCIAIASIDKKFELTKKSIEKGMIVVGPLKYTSNICFRFRARIEILHHSASININYSPMIHIGPIRQCARITEIKEVMRKTKTHIDDTNDADENKEADGLKTGDHAIVTFKFKYKAEFIEPNTVFFFREGTTRGTGTIVEVISIAEETDDRYTHADPAKNKDNRRHRRARLGK
jgi:elongation factor 1-alpha